MAPTFSVIICTRNRPEQLVRAIESVLASTEPPLDLIVGDDSTDSRTRELLAARFPSVRYVDGPRRGLGANRNAALAVAQGDRIAFIDDDVVMDPGFLSGMAAKARALGDSASRVIITGTEINRGERVFPHRPTYMGYQALDYKPGERLETVVINSTSFPRGLFETTRYDENLVYGSEEADISIRASLLRGYTILLEPTLANQHFPADENRAFYTPFVNASRVYVTWKRYRWVEGKPLKAALYLLVAWAHLLTYYLRKQKLTGFGSWVGAIRTTRGYIRNCDADRERFV